MPRSGRRSTYPWFRSTKESVPRSYKADRRLKTVEILTIIVVIAAVAKAVWFLFLQAGQRTRDGLAEHDGPSARSLRCCRIGLREAEQPRPRPPSRVGG